MSFTTAQTASSSEGRSSSTTEEQEHQDKVDAAVKRRRLALMARQSVGHGSLLGNESSCDRVPMTRTPLQNLHVKTQPRDGAAPAAAGSTPFADAPTPAAAEQVSGGSSWRGSHGAGHDDTQRSDLEPDSKRDEDEEDEKSESDFVMNNDTPNTSAIDLADGDDEPTIDVVADSPNAPTPSNGGSVSAEDGGQTQQNANTTPTGVNQCTRRFEADPTNINTWKKMPCRLALKAVGAACATRLQLKPGQAGLFQIQDLCWEYWDNHPEARVLMSAAVERYLSGSKEYVAPAKRRRPWAGGESTRNQRNPSNAEGEVVPQKVVNEVYMLIQVHGLDWAEERKAVCVRGRNYQVKDVIAAMSDEALEEAKKAYDVAKGKGKEPGIVEEKGNVEACINTVSIGRNAFARIINCLFHDNCRPYWEASELVLMGDQLGHGANGGELSFWKHLLQNVLNRDFNAGTLLESEKWGDVLKAYDPNTMDLNSTTSIADIKKWYQQLRQACNGSQRTSGVDVLYFRLWLERFPQAENFFSVLDKDIAQACVGDISNTEKSNTGKGKLPPAKARTIEGSNRRTIEVLGASLSTFVGTLQTLLVEPDTPQDSPKHAALLESIRSDRVLMKEYDACREDLEIEQRREVPSLPKVAVLERNIAKIIDRLNC